MYKKIVDRICAYKFKQRMRSLLFHYIVNTRNDIVRMVTNSARDGSRLPVGSLKHKGRLLEKYHRGIKGL